MKNLLFAPDTSAQYLTPEMAQRLADIAYAPEEGSGLQQQLEQAIALRNGQTPERHSATAALYDGIGNIARDIESHAQEKRIRGQQADLLGQQKSAYGEYLGTVANDARSREQALAEALRRLQQPSQGQHGATGQDDPFGIGLLRGPDGM